MAVVIVMLAFWLAASLVEKLGLDDPLKRVLIQILAVVGLVLGVLQCAGISLIACLRA